MISKAVRNPLSPFDVNLVKRQPKPSLLLTKTVFLIRMPFIRIKNTVGARSAQVYWWHVTGFKTA